MSQGDLEGRVAMVTGASRGIGQAIARRLAAEGCGVALVSSARSAEALADTAQGLRQAGARVVALTADLAQAAERADLIARAVEALGRVDILINNAAAMPAFAPASRIDLEARRAGFEVNVQAPLDLIQQALPAMRERAWGRIINISSEMAAQPRIPYPGSPKLTHAMTLYGASKAALERISEGLAAELDGSGVTVNVLAPVKAVATDSAAQVVAQLQHQHPDWIEPVEMMAEAVRLLIGSRLTGLRVRSRDLLQMLQAPLYSLDGARVLGDAQAHWTCAQQGAEQQ